MLEFKTYRSSTMNEYSKQFIISVFHELTNHNSFYTNLQLIYNNSLHFQTIPSNICTYRALNNITRKVFSPNKKLIIQGDIHNNHHVSGVLVDSETGHNLFVEDTYIRVKDEETNEIYHILLNPPKLSRPRPYMYYLANGCSKPTFFIPPTF
jgi:hypothetical protein